MKEGNEEKKKSFILFGRKKTSNNGSVGEKSCLFLFVQIFNAFFQKKRKRLIHEKCGSLTDCRKLKGEV